MRIRWLALLCVAALTPTLHAEDLPRVLIIGDSISIGYTLPVRKLLDGRANVHRAAANCGPTTRGLESLDAWLGDKPWDVIHFNWGLHDLKYMGPQGQNLADGMQMLGDRLRELAALRRLPALLAAWSALEVDCEP